MSELPRVLCVDDEENILKAIQRSLRKKFEIRTATSAKEGLEILEKEEPFQVIVSDMKMPEMNGAVFLSQAHKLYPDTVRLLLTGFAELENVVAAINQGHIFRFMTKPCSGADLLNSINAAVAQHKLQIAEKVLLEQTLNGSITALIDVLSLASPEAFGRANRICQLAMDLARKGGLQNYWQLEIAAKLSQIGTVTLPQETVGKIYRGAALSEREESMVARIPEINIDVLGKIPRLDEILEILEYANKNYDGSGTPQNKVAGADIPLGARLLRVAARTEALLSLEYPPTRILDDLRTAVGVYDPIVVGLVDQVIDMSGSDASVRGVSLLELRTGMILREEVKATNGLLLVASDQEVSVSLLERIQNYNDTVGLRLPLWVDASFEFEDEEGEGDEESEGSATPSPDAANHEFNFS